MQPLGNPNDSYNDMEDIKNFNPCMIYLNQYQLKKSNIQISKSIVKRKAESTITYGKRGLRSLSQ